MKKQRFKFKKKVALLMALLLTLLCASSLAISVSAANDAVQLIDSERVLVGTYGSISAAHKAAQTKKLDGYTLRLLKDVELNETLKLSNSIPASWTLEGNGKTITQTEKGEAGLYFVGNSEATVTLKNLTVTARGNAVKCESGTFNIVSGTYICKDPSVWTDAAVTNLPIDEYSSTVNIYGGKFVGEYSEPTVTGKIQCAVRQFASSPLCKAEMNIYGGYFTSISNSDKKGNDNVIYNGSTAKVAVMNIYGGTFESNNARMVVTCDYKATLNVYGGNFIGSAWYSGGDENTAGTQSYNAIINANEADSVLYVHSANMLSGALMFRAMGTGTFSAGTYKYFSGVFASDAEKRMSWAETDKEYAPKIQTGAALQLGETAGIKFTSTVSATAVDSLKALADEGTELSYGTVITGADISDVGYLSADALKANGLAYVDVKAENAQEYGEGGVRFSGAVTNIGADYYQTEFRALPYVEVIINGASVRFYGLYDFGTSSRSIAELAQAALDDVKTVQDTEYANAVGATGNYSPYTEAERTAMSGYVGG